MSERKCRDCTGFHTTTTDYKMGAMVVPWVTHYCRGESKYNDGREIDNPDGCCEKWARRMPR